MKTRSTRRLSFFLSVCLYVCLYVCPLATSLKNYWWDFFKVTGDVSVDKAEQVKFWKSSAFGFGSRSFWRILKHCEIGHFSTLWFISLGKNDRIFMKIYHTRIFDKEIPAKFWKSSLTEVFVLRVLWLWLSLLWFVSDMSDYLIQRKYRPIIPSGPKNWTIFKSVCDYTDRRPIYQNVQCTIWSKNGVLSFITVKYSLHQSSKQYYTKNNDSSFMCPGYFPVL